MPEKMDAQEINPLFRWHWPRPWPEPDPGPPWELIISQLDRTAVIRLAAVQLELAKSKLEAQKTVLDAQVRAVDQMQKIIGGGTR